MTRAVLRRLGADDRGVTAVEFAFVAPVLIVVISGLIEFSYVAYARSTLESSTVAAARVAMAHPCPSTREADMRRVITGAMSNVRSSGNSPVTIAVKAYGNEFGNVHPPEPFTDLVPRNGKWNLGESYDDVNGNGRYDSDIGKSGNLGGAGEVVSYTTNFNVISLFPSMARQFNNNQPFYSLKATTVVRNEPNFTTNCPAS